MNDWGKIESDWKSEISFVEKHEASDKIIEFTEQIDLNNNMRFDVVKSMDFRIPQNEESLFTITTKAISLLDVINFIENQKGEIEEAIIFLYTINEKAANYVCSLAKRTKLKVIVSDLMNSQREKERVITEIFDKNNVDVVFCHNHAKIAAVKIGDNYFVLSGSMNAGNNARIETLHISNSKSNYEFISGVFNQLSSKFSIKKRYGV
jgi:hypothetical protein